MNTKGGGIEHLKKEPYTHFKVELEIFE